MLSEPSSISVTPRGCVTASTAAQAPRLYVKVSFCMSASIRSSDIWKQLMPPAGLQGNAPERDWKYGYMQNFAACLINMHITQTKLKSLWWQTQTKEFSSLVQPCLSGHPLCKELLVKQTHLASAFAASKPTSALPFWCFGDQKRQHSPLPALTHPGDGNWGQRPLQLWLLFHSDIFQSEWLLL